MRKTPLIVLLLAASASVAHAQSGCRGETLSELNDCIAAATPEVAEPPAETSTVAPTQPAARVTLGGALQPRDLRADPPLAGTPAAEAMPAVPAPGRRDAAVSPFATYYGAERPAARSSRNVLGTPDVGLPGSRYNDGLPGSSFRSR